VKRILAERTAMHTGQSVEQVEADSDRDRWFRADQAKEYGFIDHVVRSANEVPRKARCDDQRSSSEQPQRDGGLTGTVRHGLASQDTSCRRSSSGRRTGSRR